MAYQQYHARGVDFLGDDMGDTAASDPPTTAVIDKTGHVAGIVLGPINDGELTALIHKAALMG